MQSPLSLYIPQFQLRELIVCFSRLNRILAEIGHGDFRVQIGSVPTHSNFIQTLSWTRTKMLCEIGSLRYFELNQYKEVSEDGTEAGDKDWLVHGEESHSTQWLAQLYLPQHYKNMTNTRKGICSVINSDLSSTGTRNHKS